MNIYFNLKLLIWVQWLLSFYLIGLLAPVKTESITSQKLVLLDKLGGEKVNWPVLELIVAHDGATDPIQFAKL